VRGVRILHKDVAVVPSPSGLPSQHIVTRQAGATSLFVGQQWIQPGERVFLHTHPVEEALMFLRGTGEAVLDGETVLIEPGSSLYIPPGVPHGFRNTGADEMHVLIVFPTPEFAETTLLESQAAPGP